jgi:hypothetical protein
MFAVAFLGWIALSILVGYVASERNRNPLGWGAVSFFFSPLIAFLGLIAIGDGSSQEGTTRETKKGSTKAWEKDKFGDNSSGGGSSTRKRECRRNGRAPFPADLDTCPHCRNPVESDGQHPLR